MMNWIKEASDVYNLETVTPQQQLISELVTAVYRYPFAKEFTETQVKVKRGILLAAAFDLLVSAEYYGNVNQVNWCYCPSLNHPPKIYYPYTNTCPYCVLNNEFQYHLANKPASGNIGAATAKLLALFFKALFAHHGRLIEVLKGAEPVDTVFLDNKSIPKVAFYAEVKSAPLLTLPLVTAYEQLTTTGEKGSVPLLEHQPATTILHLSEIAVFVPVQDLRPKSGWSYKSYFIGRKKDSKDINWAYRGILNLLKTDQCFWQDYINFWLIAYDSYAIKNNQVPFWFTNACGAPSPRPEHWRRRASGGGYESISDSKSSVGVDRTDDIKKGIYQVLKLGVDSKPLQDDYQVLTGIVSNIHAIRHFDEYLANFQDVIWTRDKSGKATYAIDLQSETPLFNLFDGLIALTQTISRHPWIATVFDF